MNFNSNYELKLKSMKKLIYLGLLAICLSINYAANASQHFLGDSNFSTSYSVANLKIKHIEFNDVSNNELRKMLNLASKKELQSKHLKDFPLDISYSYEGHDVMNYERFNGLNLTYESLDVTTHLVDLVQWEGFPDQVLHQNDVRIIGAKRWPTVLSKEDFREVTRMEQYPDYLNGAVKDGKLNDFANGEILYRLKGVFAKVTAIWDYKAPEGGGDTHYSMMRGTVSNLEIRQGGEEKFDPTLTISAAKGVDLTLFAANLEKAVKSLPQSGLSLQRLGSTKWKVIIPEVLKIGHEAHFAQVTAKYLEYLKRGKLPEWEVPNMITKYYTTTAALKLAKGTP